MFAHRQQRMILLEFLVICASINSVWSMNRRYLYQEAASQQIQAQPSRPIGKWAPSLESVSEYHENQLQQHRPHRPLIDDFSDIGDHENLANPLTLAAADIYYPLPDEQPKVSPPASVSQVGSVLRQSQSIAPYAQSRSKSRLGLFMSRLPGVKQYESIINKGLMGMHTLDLRLIAESYLEAKFYTRHRNEARLSCIFSFCNGVIARSRDHPLGIPLAVASGVSAIGMEIVLNRLRRLQRDIKQFLCDHDSGCFLMDQIEQLQCNTPRSISVNVQRLLNELRVHNELPLLGQ
ncbi:hypothetical protein MP228_009516 [Amoeboaphelidium protococcarum]|nr:hypothetical protein MP228_009516 [Amoeboaphelidium protococcarum]